MDGLGTFPRDLGAMSEVVQQTPQEFWRPPSPMAVAEEVMVRGAIPVMAEACPHCGTEFLLGSRFCHTCGAHRPEAARSAAHADTAAFARFWERTMARTRSAVTAIPWSRMWNWIRIPTWLRSLHFKEIQRWIGLSTASLIAFFIGMGCVAGALLVGLLQANTLVDWQAIQFYRVEWLLAAVVCFVAGMLLKNPSGRDRD